MSKIIIILFRESIEIALLLGTIFAATKSIPNAVKHIIAGIILGLIGSSILAFFTSNISNSFNGQGQEIFNIAILSLSIFLIMWTVIWMKSRAKNLKHDLNHLTEKIVQGDILVLTLPIMVATFIFREGTEIVLFVYGILTVEKLSTIQLLISVGSGVSLGLLVGLILYLGLVQYSGRKLFQITSWLFILIAASLSTEVANLLNSINILPQLSKTLWDTSWLIPDGSIVGDLLNSVIGYQARPSLLQIMLYISTILMILAIDKIYNRKK
jgi:high-affinity iron transporter